MRKGLGEGLCDFSSSTAVLRPNGLGQSFFGDLWVILFGEVVKRSEIVGSGARLTRLVATSAIFGGLGRALSCGLSLPSVVNVAL